MLLACASLAGCALFARGSDEPPPERAPAFDPAELSLDTLLAGDFAPSSLAAWRREIQARAEDPRRVQRAEWTVGLLLAARLDAVAAPQRADVALDAARALTGCTAATLDAGCMRRSVAADLGGVPAGRTWAALVELAWGDAAAVDPAVWSTDAEAARAAALIVASNGADWLAAEPVDPRGAPPFVDEVRRLQQAVEGRAATDAADAMAVIHAGCSASLDGAWASALMPRAARVCGALASARVPLAAMPSSMVDVTLQVPRAFDEAPVSTAWPFDAALVVRSTGVSFRRQQSLVWDGAAAVADPPSPEEELLRFEGPGMVAVDDLAAGRLPGLTDALRARVGEDGTPLSLIVDGNTYYATLRPILWAAADAGFGPLTLHLVSADGERFAAAPVTLVPESVAMESTVRVRQDGYLVQGASEDEMVAPHTISRVGDAPLLELVRYVESLVATEADDVHLTLVVEDGTADVGILAHVLSALAWRRDTALLYDDLGLLRAAPIVYGNVPARLAPGGVRLAY